MRYNVGDKVRVKKDLKVGEEYGGMIFNDSMSKHCGETVTINEVLSRGYYRIVEYGWYWTDEMFDGLVEDELTAEEAIMLRSEMCVNTSCCDCKLSARNNGTGISCNKFSKKYPERVIEILKQRKKEHEKKEVETEITWCVLIIEADTHTLKHEEKVGTDFKSMDAKKAEILKKYCSEHDGKYYAISERRCVVKE